MRRMMIRTALAIAMVAMLAPAGASASRNAYVADLVDGKIAVLSDDVASGVLTPTGSADSGSTVVGLVLTADGRHLYVANYGSPAIYGYSVAADGALTALPGSPFPTADDTFALTATADGKYLYAANRNSQISGYSVGGDGALAALPDSPYPSVPNLYGIASSPDSKLLYASTDGGPTRLAGYSIGSDGALQPLSATMPSPGTSARQLVFAPDGKRLYVEQYAEDRVSAYDVASSGALSEIGGSPFTVGDGPYGLAMSPDGATLIVTAFNGDTVASYPLAAGGSLGAAGSSLPAGNSTMAAAVSPDSRFAYAAGGSSPTAYGFGIGAGSVLTPLTGSPFLDDGSEADFQGIAISPNQPPQATFRVNPAEPGIKEQVRFNAKNSTDPDGTVASYLFDYGDGKTKTSTDGSSSHKYKTEGTYAVTVTETDNEGCSTTVVYTGQTASCNGSSAAVATREVVVADREVDNPQVTAKSKQKQDGKKIEVKVTAKAGEKVTAVATGTVKIKGKGKKLALLKKKKDLKAKQKKSLTLKLKQASANKKVFKALDDKKPVKAKVQVKLTDEAGNFVTVKQTIELK